MLLVSRILEVAARHPQRLALEFLPDGRRWTYRELAGDVTRVADALRRRGAGVGERISVQVGSSPEMLLLHLAAMHAGVVLNPLNPAYTPSEVEFFLSDAEPSLFVVEEEPAGDLAAVVPDSTEVISLSELCEHEGLWEEGAGCDDDDVAVLLYTSGTTGRSKGAMITHRNLGANAENLRSAWGISGDDVILHVLPLHHVHGLFVAIHPFLLEGGSILLAGRFDPDVVADTMARSTVMMGVPTMYVRLLADGRVDRDLASGMRLFTSGSAPMLERTHEEWERRTGHRILERYGMTEIQMACSNPLEGERRPGTVGLPLPDVEVRVRGDDGTLVGSGHPGVLEVRGPTVLRGYWRLPDATAGAFTDGGWFVTGDIVTRSDDGYVTIVGRASDLVITGGLNVYPREVEDVVDTVDGVIESAVIGVPHPDLGEAVVAVCAMGGGAEVDPGAVISACRGRLAGYKIPKRVVSVPELPRNTMGKVQKGHLRDRLGSLFEGS